MDGWSRGRDCTGRAHRRDRDWCALGSSNWRSKKADYAEGEGGHCVAKKDEHDEETIDKTASKVDECPQSFQKNRSQDGKSSGKKANAESRTSIEAACDCQKGRAKVEQVTLALERTG